MITENSAKVNAHSRNFSPYTATTIIEVLAVEPGEIPGLVATVAVRIGGIVFRDVRVVDRGRGVFVNFPSRKQGDKWVHLVELVSPALRDAVEAAILTSVGGVRL